MPVSNEIELPIGDMPLAGPCVEALERRKEANSNPRIAAAELGMSFQRVKNELFMGIRALVRAAPRGGAGERGQD